VHLLYILKEVDNEPHGILLISALLKRESEHQVSLVVATEEDPVEAAVRLQPDVVGFTVYTGMQHYYIDLSRQIKARLPNVLSIFGGPHPTFFPEMINEEGVDAICLGEGEYAVLELMNTLQSGDSIDHVPNWWVKRNERIIRNGLRPLLTPEELDALPFADRALLYEAHPPSKTNKIRPFITGRGCPYNCSFCFNKAYSELYDGKGRRTRRRSVDNVIREIKLVREQFELAFIIFMDDTFILNRKWLNEFAERHKTEIGLPFWCQVRADLVTDDLIQMFAEVGCVSVSFGLESGNDQMRNVILNRNMTREEILNAAEILRRHGIRFMTNNMLGLPSGSLETDWDTLHLNIACRPSYANVFLFQPYPGTQLAAWATTHGWITGSFDDLSGSVSDDTIILFGSPSEKRQIENLQKLFALTVEFPFLAPFVRQLIKLPKNPVFWLIYKFWKGYAIKRRMFPFRLTPREYVQAAWQYMRIRSQ
jgi:anaerobic magnesium-protoporphyrin IX monomethyl ester cyclase